MGHAYQSCNQCSRVLPSPCIAGQLLYWIMQMPHLLYYHESNIGILESMMFAVPEGEDLPGADCSTSCCLLS